MTITTEATVANGQLRLQQPLPLAEGTAVRLTITPLDQIEDPLANVIGICDGPPDGAANHDKYIYGDRRK